MLDRRLLAAAPAQAFQYATSQAGYVVAFVLLVIIVPIVLPWGFRAVADLFGVSQSAFAPAEWAAWLLGAARLLRLPDDVVNSLQDGAIITIRVTVRGACLGTAMAVLAGLSSFSSWRAVRGASRAYVEFFRGTSAIVQLFWVFYGLPLIAPALPDIIPERFVRLEAMEAGVIVLGLNMGAYGAEVVRGAIQAVGQGQREAATALSLTSFQRMRHVIFPQAVLTMLPPYGNLLIELLKGTALVSLINLSDMTFEAQKLRTNHTAESPVIYSTLLVMYFAIAALITASIRFGEHYFARGLDIGRGK